MKPTRILLLLAAAVFAAGCTSSRPASPSATQASAGASADEQQDDDPRFKPYDEVVSDTSQTDAGLFTVHRVDDKLYYEIPDSLLEREMLLVSRIAKTADEIGYGGEEIDNHVVRWQRQDDNILFRLVSYENVASEGQPIYQAVRNSNFEPIVGSFEIAARNEDSTASVIDVTGLFTSDVPMLGLQSGRREQYRVRRLDDDRTFLNWAKSFPENIEVRNTLTYDAANAPSNSSTGTISLEMNHSMVLLPAEPMQPRRCDERVGYFSVERVNYGLDTQRAEEECFITRWRLEPSDPEAFARGELVEPVEPIVYYIDPATPMKWRPYLKQGVEDWNAAFEAAGFKNAIRAADPPSPEEDPEFSPEDARYSVIRYFSSDIQNAYGPHVHDPRSGEILESDIGWYHNVMNLLRNWFFIQTAAVNPDARGVEFDDAVMGELVRFVSAHEVGHTLGLPHNWGSSYAYPVDSLRSPSFTMLHGTAPSIMDYARFNYVAQPGDSLTDLRQFMPAVGEYDKWAVRWGYQPIPQADTAVEEEPILDAWIAEKAGDPRYFYGRQTGAKIDPRSQNEDLGDDAVLASTYGLQNLQRIVPQLVAWTEREGENYDDLEELYGQVIGQWNRYLGHVRANVGGVYENYKTYDQDGVVYEVVPEEEQRAAMAFLAEEGLQTPTWLLHGDVLDRIEAPGAVDRIRRLQVGILDDLLDPQVLARLIEAEARYGNETYTPAELFTDVRGSVWSELARGEAVDPYRRSLQRAYVEQMEALMTEEAGANIPAAFRSYYGYTPVDVSQSDIRAYVRGELETLQSEVERALRRTNDRTTQLHLRDIQARIEDVLDGDDA